MANTGRFHDRNPEILTAGKTFSSFGSVPECVQAYNPDKPESPAVVKRFRATFEPAAGENTRHYGKADDKETTLAPTITHGVPSVGSGDTAKAALNPDPKTLFAWRVQLQKERVYESSKTKPLGQIPDQRHNLPAGTHIYETQFGKPCVKEDWAGEIVNPRKTQEEVEAESLEGKELYVKSHGAWSPGEQMTREYDWSKWDPGNRFGYPTPANERGIHTKAALYWQTQRQMDKGSIITSKAVDEFREKYTDQVGLPRDPIKDTMNVPEDHTFGIIVRPDGYGVDDILHGRGPKHYLRGKDRERAILAAVRANLKTNNFNRFDDLAVAFANYDKEGTGKLSVDTLRKMCSDFNVPIEDVVLETLFDFCDRDNKGYIDYAQFANFLNWQRVGGGVDPNGQREHITETGDTPRKIENQLDKSLGNYKTSASQVNATVGSVPPQKEYRAYGVPSIRTDRNPPKQKSVSDRTNYGDEADAWGLVTPSIFTNQGIYEEELFQPRQPQEMRSIFRAIGEEFEDDVFTDIWNQAATLHPRGKVNVECFRQVMNKMATLSAS